MLNLLVYTFVVCSNSVVAKANNSE